MMPSSVSGQGIEPLIEEVKDLAELQSRASVTRRDLAAAIILGFGFTAFALACSVQTRVHSWQTVAVAGTLVIVYGLAHRTKFEAPTGSTVPTEPVLVALLFAAPISAVPLLVLAGLLLGGSWREGPGSTLYGFLVRASSGWYCAGPVALLWLLDIHSPQLDRWPLLLAALGSQFLGDAIVALLRCLSLRTSPRRLVEPLLFTFTVDSLLAPLAVCAVLVTGGSMPIVIFPLLPVALLRVMAIDRNRRIETAVTLGRELQTIRDESRTDSMTGLANRRAWEEAVAFAEETLQDARKAQGMMTVVLMADVDYLKAVNDTFGHEAGDDLLRAFAILLRNHAPEGSVVARVGGDEFGVMFRVARDQHAIVDGFVAELKEKMGTSRIRCGSSVSASIGVASCPQAQSVAEAIRLADARAATDKDARKARRRTPALFEGRGVPGLRSDQAELLLEQLGEGSSLRAVESLLRARQQTTPELIGSLRGAMSRSELFVVYQPLFSLEDHALRGAEALVRWRHPAHGVLLPAEFIPLAEDFGLVGGIDAFVLQEALSQLASWIETSGTPSGFTMAVNLSASVLSDTTLASRIVSSVGLSGISPERLCLEISESALIDDIDNAEANLAELSHLGVRLALDDFGTRYSTLAHLQRLNVDILKVDRSFVAGVARSERDRKIIGGLTSMAHALGMSVVGEGIETHEQLDELTRLGCDEGQGFLLARPLPAEEMAKLRGLRQTALAL